MHRRGGKRIRMDDPPPEYENPMTPATPMTDYSGRSVHEPETPDLGFGGAPVANSTVAEALDEDSHREDEEARSPSPAPTKRITRSRGRGGDGGGVGRLAESPPPPPLRRRGRGGGRGRGRGRGAAPPPAMSPPPVLLPGDDENSLYNILRFNKSAINQVVDMWIEQYKTNREGALVQLMQFFINASGCRGKVTPDMAQMDHTLIIKKMTQEFDEESGEYPLIMSGQTWKKFKSNFCEFIQTLVKMCQYSIIYDQYLMDNIISLLTGLSDSQVRAFRHTATLAVMKLMTALVDVALLTSVNCDNCLRQYEAERLKARDKRASERLEVLVAKRQELEENMEEIKNMLSYMFKSVFVHRYRDTLPDIRSITMAEIGIWMEKFPAHFLDDLYLKYIGWTLHDKVGEVRLRCLQALQPLYECEELKGKLELFTSKFKDRIVSMTLDKETEVAVHAVKLVIAILKMHPDVLTDKDCENVYELVYSSCRGVAAAAGEFLNVRLFRPEPAASPPGRSRRGKQRAPSTPLVRDLVQFFIESELHEHGAYLVDSLIESNPMMKDWECMTDLLLEEAGPGEEALDNRQESSLIELMVCCVRQAATGEPPVGRAPRRQHHQPVSKQVAEDRARMTAHYIGALPLLLEKFGADPEKLTNLVSIPQYFDLELYTTQRQEGNLTLLLNKIRDIVSTQTEAEVLETCGRTLECLCDEQSAVYTRCNVARATVTDMVVNRYKEAIDEYRSLIEGGETPDADEVFNVINSLRKVSIMYMCHNLNDTNIWDSLMEDLPKCGATTGPDQHQLPEQALVYVVRALFYSLAWSLHTVEERWSAGACVDAECEAVRVRLHAYAQHCTAVIASNAPQALQEEAYTSLCDLVLLFCEGAWARQAAPPALRQLVLEPDAPLADLLNSFIQQFVFVHHNYDGQDERRIEELHKRRNFLAAYCKLIVYSVVPIRRAADVFKHYIKCYNDYGDIIKATLSKARELNKLNCALTMELAMQALFTECRQRHLSQLHRQLPEIQQLKELAKRFSVMFGQDVVKNREALTALHRAGISFAAIDAPPPAHGTPPNLLFLEALAEFSNKLLKQDKRQVLKVVESRIPCIGSQWGEEWAPLHTYRASLLSDAPEPTHHPPKKNYARRRGQHDDDDGEDNADSDQEQPGRGRRRVRMPRPARASRPSATPLTRRSSRIQKLDVTITRAALPKTRTQRLTSETSSERSLSIRTASSGKPGIDVTEDNTREFNTSPDNASDTKTVARNKESEESSHRMLEQIQSGTGHSPQPNVTLTNINNTQNVTEANESCEKRNVTVRTKAARKEMSDSVDVNSDKDDTNVIRYQNQYSTVGDKNTSPNTTQSEATTTRSKRKRWIDSDSEENQAVITDGTNTNATPNTTESDDIVTTRKRRHAVFSESNINTTAESQIAGKSVGTTEPCMSSSKTQETCDETETITTYKGLEVPSTPTSHVVAGEPAAKRLRMSLVKRFGERSFRMSKGSEMPLSTSAGGACSRRSSSGGEAAAAECLVVRALVHAENDGSSGSRDMSLTLTSAEVEIAQYDLE